MMTLIWIAFFIVVGLFLFLSFKNKGGSFFSADNMKTSRKLMWACIIVFALSFVITWYDVHHATDPGFWRMLSQWSLLSIPLSAVLYAVMAAVVHKQEAA